MSGKPPDPYPEGVLFVLLLVCVALVVGLSLIGAVVSILTSVLVGLLIGFAARVIAPGPVRLGLLLTAASGIAGSLIGTTVARVLHQGTLGRFLLQLLAATLLVMVLGTRQRLRSRSSKKKAKR
jgi:uncharacterized membrane protein YeaQ/YmgE (transglycosylase-associated protein family)